MSNEAKFYNPNEVFVSLADRAISKGRAEGEFVSTDYNADSITETVGADGEVAVSISQNKSAVIKLKVMQTSSSHSLLTQLYDAWRADPSTLLAFELRDLRGSKIEHALVYFKKPPPSTYSAVAGEREWTLGTAELVRESVAAGTA